MKALSVRQPWAWAIAKGYKPVENRTWSTAYRGPLAIHAAARWDDAPEEALRFVVHALRAQGSPVPRALQDELPWSGTGMVVAVVNFADICAAHLRGRSCGCCIWAADGQAHWQFADARPLPEPIPAKGRLGLWNIDLEVPA